MQKPPLHCYFEQNHNVWPDASHCSVWNCFPCQPLADSLCLLWGLLTWDLFLPTDESSGLQCWMWCLALDGGLKDDVCYSLQHIATLWPLCGRCVHPRAVKQQLKMRSSVLLLRHWGHGGDSASLLKKRLDGLLQRQWITLRKFCVGCIKIYFSYHFHLTL